MSGMFGVGEDEKFVIFVEGEKWGWEYGGGGVRDIDLRCMWVVVR